MGKLPDFLKKYFWDVEFRGLDLEKYRIYVLKRILEYGDKQAVDWMWKNFSKTEIKEVLINYRGFSRKTANFWALLLDIDKKEVLCLKKSSLREQGTIWPY